MNDTFNQENINFLYIGLIENLKAEEIIDFPDFLYYLLINC